MSFIRLLRGLSLATQEILVENGLDDPGLFSALTSDPEFVWSEMGVDPGEWEVLRAIEPVALVAATRLRNIRAGMPTELMVAATVAENRAKQEAHFTQQCTNISKNIAVHVKKPKTVNRTGTKKKQLQAARNSVDKFEGHANAVEKGEELKRRRWCAEVALHLRLLDIPVLKLAANSGDVDSTLMRGCGRLRSCTLQGRVTVWRHYDMWCKLHRRVPLPTTVSQVLEFLKERVRGGVKASYLQRFILSLRFMERVSGLEPTAACGQSQLLRGQLDGLKLEVITASDVKGPAPRPCVAHLAALERAVIDVCLPVVVRVHAFWHLMCAWGALRHADHRGMNPDHFVLTKEGGLIGYATRTKTTGTDKKFSRRPVCVSGKAYVHNGDWVRIGWSLLINSAPNKRDYPIPVAGKDLHTWTTRPQLHSEAKALSFHLASLLVGSDGSFLFRGSTERSYLREHSYRCFLPSAAACLLLPEGWIDSLGAWRPQGGMTYVRTACCRMLQVQSGYAQKFRSSGNIDVFGEWLGLKIMEKALIERGASEELAYELVQKLTLEREHTGKQGDSVDTAGADSEMEISRLGRVPQAVIPQPSSDSGRYYICLGSRCKTLHRVGQGQCGEKALAGR